MRALVVGGGIAGLTVAALLGRQGHEVEVVEKRTAAEASGYALALWPHGSRVFHALGLHDRFVERSEPMRRYTARDGRGRVLISSPMPQTIASFGHLGIVPRSELLSSLAGAAAAAGVPVRYGATVTHVEDHGHQVTVTSRASGAARADQRVDLVIAADGVGSPLRRLLWGRVPGFDTGWGCHAWWADHGLVPPGETIEQWAPGSFLGTYPTRDRLCVIAGAPVTELEGDGHQPLRARLAGLSAFRGWDADALTADLVVDGPEPVLWRMADVRSPTWVRGRVALVGDAAAAFMPTAGIGASMALESAAALADELSRADAAHVPHALALFERRRRRRVEVAQTQSRRLARLMFVRSPALSIARDRIAGRASMEQVVAPLIRSLAEPL